MSTVVAFHRTKLKTGSAARSQGPADILLFTGVRYERLEDPAGRPSVAPGPVIGEAPPPPSSGRQ